MKPRTAKYLKDHYLNYYKKLDNCRLEEMDIKKYNCDVQDHIHFSFDCSTSNLIITGDFGNAIFSWYTNSNSLSMINDYIKDDPDYFASKCLTSDRPCYIYDQDLAYKEIVDWLYEHNAQNLDWDNDVIYETTVDNLFVIPAGPIPPNPSELMGSRRMDKLREALEEKLDLVIYDAPPVLSVTDAQLLSAKVDGTILIVRQGFAEKEGVRQAVDLLKHVNAHIIGAVLNDVDASTDGYYGYYGYGKEK